MKRLYPLYQRENDRRNRPAIVAAIAGLICALSSLVTAHAASQGQTGPKSAFTADVLTIVRTATKASVFSFDGRQALSPSPTVSTVDHKLAAVLAPNRVHSLSRLAGETASYELSQQFASSCVFAPTVGIEFTSAAGSAWWMITNIPKQSACSNAAPEAILVRETDNWRNASSLTLKRGAAANIRKYIGKVKGFSQ